MNHDRSMRGMWAAVIIVMVAACTGAPVERAAAGHEAEPVSAVAAVPEVAAPVVPVAAAATGRDACDSLPIDCVRAIASRQEEGQTIVYITPAETGRVRPGQWVHCEKKERRPSPPCEVLDIVDAGMLEARCSEAAPTCPPPST